MPQDDKDIRIAQLTASGLASITKRETALAVLKQSLAANEFALGSLNDYDNATADLKAAVNAARKLLGMPPHPDAFPAEAARHAAIVQLAKDEHQDEGTCEIDEGAVLSEGDANGCYVQAWVWVSFAGTDFDKEPEE